MAVKNELITSCLIDFVEEASLKMQLYARNCEIGQAEQDLKTLLDVFWNPVSSALSSVQYCKRVALSEMDKVRETVLRRAKKEEPHDHDCGDGGCGGKHRHVNDDLCDYQLLLFTYSLASFLEVVLEGQDQYDALDDIEDCSVEYQMLYTSCCNNVSDYAAQASGENTPTAAGVKMSQQAIALLRVVEEDVAKPFIMALE